MAAPTLSMDTCDTAPSMYSHASTTGTRSAILRMWGLLTRAVRKMAPSAPRRPMILVYCSSRCRSLSVLHSSTEKPCSWATSSMPRTMKEKNGLLMSGSTTMMVAVRLMRRLRAETLGSYPSFLTAAATRRRVSGRPASGELRIRDTVAVDTPARRATSFTVTKADQLHLMVKPAPCGRRRGSRATMAGPPAGHRRDSGRCRKRGGGRGAPPAGSRHLALSRAPGAAASAAAAPALGIARQVLAAAQGVVLRRHIVLQVLGQVFVGDRRLRQLPLRAGDRLAGQHHHGRLDGGAPLERGIRGREERKSDG